MTLSNVVQGDFSQVVHNSKNGFIPVVLTDLQGTYDDGETIARAFWRDLLLEHGAVIDYGSNCEYMDDSGAFVVGENIEQALGRNALNWYERWNGAQDTWYGSGNEFVHSYLVENGYIDKNHPDANYAVIAKKIAHDVSDRIARGELKRRDGVDDFYKFLAKYNIPKGIVTNDPFEMIYAKQGSMNFHASRPDQYNDPHNFQFILSGPEAGIASKPEPDLYLEALRKMESSIPNARFNIIILEDSSAGLISAARAKKTIEGRGHKCTVIHMPYQNDDPVHDAADARVNICDNLKSTFSRQILAIWNCGLPTYSVQGMTRDHAKR